MTSFYVYETQYEPKKGAVGMREIKFRAWDGKEMNAAFDLTQNPKYWWKDNKDYPLMQFTGLKDRNGVDVYEGDIVIGLRPSHWHEGYDKVKAVVVYREEVASFDADSSKHKTLMNGGSLHNIEHLEIIGNIHENPELLLEVTN